MPPKLKKSKIKLSDCVYNKLEHMIVFCEIEPGSILSEAEISELVNVGRTPVREALGKLSQEGLVKNTKSGVFIPEVNAIDQLNLLKLRRVIEKFCIECAVDSISQKEKNEMQVLVESFDSVDCSDECFLDYLKKAHQLLGESTKNKFAAASLVSVQGLSRRFWLYFAKREDYDISKRIHKSILKAVLEENKEKALNASEELMNYLEEFSRKQLP